MLVLAAMALVRLHSLVNVAMLSSIYSLLSASIFMQMDAVDVAFTEAAVGAGITTVLLLSALAIVGKEEKISSLLHIPSLLAVVLAGLALIYATFDMPYYGDPEAPIHQHVAPHYIKESKHEVGPPNIVTSILASYRGYDTLGEVTVIFTAAIAVLLLLGGNSKNKNSEHPL